MTPRAERSGRGEDRDSGGERAGWPLATSRRLPDPTPADGPDPYGSPAPAWLEIDWRQQLRGVTVRGASVNYVELGSGPPVVLVHGLAGCWQNWLENIPHLASRHRVVAVDLPGFGRSPMPPWEPSIPNYARFLDDFCEQLDLEGCALVGSSMGGFIAAEVAIREPQWVERLVLVSAAGISHARMRREPVEAAARMAVIAAPLLVRLQRGAVRRPRLRYATFRNVFHAPHKLRPELLAEHLAGALSAPGFVPASVRLIGYDFLDQLEKVKVPTLIVWGRNDRVVPVADALEYARVLRGSRLVIFDRCGHLPMSERPLRFNRLLDAFFAEPAGVPTEGAATQAGAAATPRE